MTALLAFFIGCPLVGALLAWISAQEEPHE